MSKKDKDIPTDEVGKEHRETLDENLDGADVVTENDPEGYQEEADTAAEELEKEKEKFIRLFAEFENYKRRTSRERMELFKTAGQEVITALLPVLDDFDRALDEIEKSNDQEVLTGVKLIYTKLKETLRLKGLEEVKVKKGDRFDAEIHEALTQIPAPTKKLKGKIVDVVEKGYALGDKIIRHPKVVVGQ